MIVALIFEAVNEALLLAVTAGADPAKICALEKMANFEVGQSTRIPSPFIFPGNFGVDIQPRELLKNMFLAAVKAAQPEH